MQLPVENAAVSNDNDAVKNGLTVRAAEISELMREPGNAIGFAGPGAVLDQIVMAAAVGFGVIQQFAHRHELMKAREDEFFPAGFGVAFRMQIILNQQQQ